MTRYLVLALLLVAAGSRNIVWNKPGLDQAQFNRDNYECQSENTYYYQGYRPTPVTGQQTTAQGGFAQGFSNTFSIPAGPRVNVAGYKSCMYARGYYEE